MKSQLDNQQGYKLVEFGEDFDEVASGKSWKNDVIDECDNLPIITKCSMRLEDTMGPRFKNFLDSSIWFYAYSTDAELEEIKRQIIKNNKRYTLKKAREYREFYTRMLANAYLSGDHDAFVSPFLFHSEQEIKKKNEDNEHKKIINEIKKYKWRILLVDDNSDKKRPMSIATEDHQELQSEIIANITKLDIVKEEFGKLFGDDRVTTDSSKINANIYIDCASSIEEAKSKLSRKKYEIILLDYLLGKKGGEGREYGYELLNWISNQEKAAKGNKNAKFDYKKGPDNRFYFMFISAFTTAVSERLLTEGWARSEKFWYIGEGACPINTPYLFQYRLLHIMQKRMETMGIQELDGICSLFKNTEVNFLESEFYKNIVNEIYCTEGIIGTKKGNVRKRANDKFQEVLNLLYSYKNLLNDTQITHDKFIAAEESVLATDFVVKNLSLGAFLEHFTQLVYLTAFGTVRQWSEMWEEYQFIKSMVGPIKCIENYIVGLKNNCIK